MGRGIPGGWRVFAGFWKDCYSVILEWVKMLCVMDQKLPKDHCLHYPPKVGINKPFLMPQFLRGSGGFSRGFGQRYKTWELRTNIFILFIMEEDENKKII